MPYDKIIDSEKLDSDLTAVADAIRNISKKSDNITFPEGFVSEIDKAREFIMKMITRECEDEEYIYLPEGITDIGEYAFAGFSKGNDARIVLPSTIKYIGAYAFADDGVYRVDMSKVTLAKIPSHCCYGNSTLSNFVYPKGVTEIGSYAFSNCYEFYPGSLPDTLVTIGSYAFDSTCCNLKEIPASVKTIGANAFRYCEYMRNLTFKGTPTTIASNAFDGCENLTKINVPWASGAVAGAPWGATEATINYNYVG